MANYGGRPVANRGVPAQIKCNTCNKVKPSATCYSNSQKAALLEHIRSKPNFNLARDAYAVCTSCTSQQRVEMMCNTCDKTKGLDKFSKAQRQKPDTAECWTCQQERLNTEPGAGSSDEDSVHGGSDDDDDGYDSDDSYPQSSVTGGASLHTDMDNLSVGGAATYASHTSTSGSTGGVDLSRASQSAGTSSNLNGGWSSTSNRNTSYGASPATTTGNRTPSTTSSNRTVATNGFNCNAYSNPGRRAPPSEAGSTRSTLANTRSSKWAKPETVKVRIKFQKAEEEREQERSAAAAVDDDDREYNTKDSDSE